MRYYAKLTKKLLTCWKLPGANHRRGAHPLFSGGPFRYFPAGPSAISRRALPLFPGGPFRYFPAGPSAISQRALPLPSASEWRVSGRPITLTCAFRVDPTSNLKIKLNGGYPAPITFYRMECIRGEVSLSGEHWRVSGDHPRVFGKPSEGIRLSFEGIRSTFEGFRRPRVSGE